ncbi:MAG: carboxypeptidase regulatory-like domain-containing protein [Janthinobacterium lividum]
MNRYALKSVTAIAISCTLASGAMAQTSKGAIAGIAKDASGAVIPNATVTIKGEQTGETRTLTTGADGSFRADALSPEAYTISATGAGFQGFQAQHVLVPASTVTTYNVTLTVGSQNDTVTVEANSETINTVNGQLAGTISSTEIAKLPVFTLNPLELASTIPGVQTVPVDNQLSNGVNIQVDGARPRSNNFLLDSQEINDVGIGGQAFQPNISDLYQDETVITSVASAEFGRSGGGVFNLVTKSGANTFHGSAYDRYTSAGLNALPQYLRGIAGNTNPRQTSHTIGGTLGGYIIKDKLFAFGGVQFQRYYGTTQIAPVLLPDAAGVATLASLTNGVAASQVRLLNQYTTNNAYLSSYALLANQPTSRINIGVQPGCAASTNGGNCFVEEAYFQRAAAALQNPDTQWSYRIDFKPHDKDTFYFRYLHDRNSLTPDFFANAAGGALGLDTQQGGPSELGAGSWTHVFTGNTLNEFRASETRISFAFAPTAATLANPAYALPLLGLAGFPSSSLGAQTGSFPQGRAEDLYQVQDTFTYTHGRQAIRAGVDIGHQLEKDTIGVNAGTISYAKGSAQSALQNFLANQTGASGSITKTIGPRRTDPHVWRSGFFFQDDVKFAPNFTVNLGMRYDYTGNPENSLAYPGVDESNPYQPLATAVRVKNDKNNLSPRIGFAYTPNQGGYFGSGKTVLRGGFGMFYDSFFSNFVTNAAQSAPNAIAGTLTSTTGVGVANANATLATFTPTLNANASQTTVASNLKNPASYQYNLGLEQEVKGAILAVRYVGVRSYDLFANTYLNPFSGLTGTRLNTSRGAITVRDNSASSNYNGVITEFSRHFGSYLSVRANYTFSKSLDNGSEIFAIGNSPTSAAAILGPVGRSQEYGPSAFDHRHYASISYVLTPKGYHVSNKFADTLLGAVTRNYTISGVEQFQSGSYGTFALGGDNSSLDNNGDGNTFNDRPILGNIGKPYQTVGIDGSFVGGTPGVYYDNVALNATGAMNTVTAADVHFLIPNNTTGQYNRQLLGRNTFSNPGSTRNDVSIQKGFGTGLFHLERGQLLLRMDVQNVANHNDRQPYLDTNILDYGTGPTTFDTQSLARNNPNNQNNGRQIYLWGRFIF